MKKVFRTLIAGALTAFIYCAAVSGFADLRLNLLTGALLGFKPVVIVRHADGSQNWYQLSGAASDTTRGAALNAAKATLIANEMLEIGPGHFLITFLHLANDTHMRGAGQDATFIDSANPITSGPIITPGNNSYIFDLTVNGTAGSGISQAPIGSSNHANSGTFTNATLWRVKTVADSDGLYISNTGSSLTAFSCSINSKYDLALAQSNGGSPAGTIKLYNCALIALGPSSISSGQARGVLATGNSSPSGFVYMYGGSISVDGGATGNIPFYTSGNGYVEAHNVAVYRGTGGAGTSYDARADGSSTLRLNNCVRSDGVKLVTIGTITRIGTAQLAEDNVFTGTNKFIASSLTGSYLQLSPSSIYGLYSDGVSSFELGPGDSGFVLRGPTVDSDPIFSVDPVNGSARIGSGNPDDGDAVLDIYRGNAAGIVRLSPDLLTALRTQHFPDKNGTFAMTSDVPVASDTAYNATSWDGNTDVPTKNAVRDKIESLGGGGGGVTGSGLTNGNVITGAGGSAIQDGGVPLTGLQSQYQAATVSAAGNTNSNIASVSHTAYITANAGAGTYTATFSIPTSGRAAGDRENVHVHYAASVNPRVELRNNTSGGTLLFYWQADGRVTDLVAECRFDGSAWYLHDAHFVY